jgi:hypothetical protein
MIANAREKNRLRGAFCKYPECGNVSLPSNFNAGLRARPGFLLASFRLIGLFRRLLAPPTIATGAPPRGYMFRANMIQDRLTKPET